MADVRREHKSERRLRRKAAVLAGTRPLTSARLEREILQDVIEGLPGRFHHFNKVDLARKDIIETILRWSDEARPNQYYVWTRAGLRDVCKWLGEGGWRAHQAPPNPAVYLREMKCPRVIIGSLTRDCSEPVAKIAKRMRVLKRTGVEPPRGPTPKYRQAGQPVYLQFAKNLLIPSFQFQDKGCRTVTTTNTTVTPGINLTEHMVRMVMEVDDHEQDYVERNNRSVLVHAVRFKLFEIHGAPAAVANLANEQPPRGREIELAEPALRREKLFEFANALYEALESRQPPEGESVERDDGDNDIN
ncbi:MAG: hypothetical protein M1827_001994 [Pycnora praestabilis]|nr:MAG: hypothetical protein M1827_001994 [Pycnora praestabilis]